MNKLDIIYYLGIFGILFVVGYLLFVNFKEYDEINLREHLWIIILYVVVLIISVVVWRLMFNFIFEAQHLISVKNNISIKDYQ